MSDNSDNIKATTPDQYWAYLKLLTPGFQFIDQLGHVIGTVVSVDYEHDKLHATSVQRETGERTKHEEPYYLPHYLEAFESGSFLPYKESIYDYDPRLKVGFKFTGGTILLAVVRTVNQEEGTMVVDVLNLEEDDSKKITRGSLWNIRGLSDMFARKMYQPYEEGSVAPHLEQRLLNADERVQEIIASLRDDPSLISEEEHTDPRPMCYEEIAHLFTEGVVFWLTHNPGTFYKVLAQPEDYDPTDLRCERVNLSYREANGPCPLPKADLFVVYDEKRIKFLNVGPTLDLQAFDDAFYGGARFEFRSMPRGTDQYVVVPRGSVKGLPETEVALSRSSTNASRRGVTTMKVEELVWAHMANDVVFLEPVSEPTVRKAMRNEKRKTPVAGTIAVASYLASEGKLPESPTPEMIDWLLEGVQLNIEALNTIIDKLTASPMNTLQKQQLYELTRQLRQVDGHAL
jgi:hypothetical protein